MSKQIYREIYDDIINKIISGEYVSGQKLPSQRELSKLYNSSASSIEKAIELLSRDGFIDTRERSGNYVVVPKKNVYTLNYDYATLTICPEITEKLTYAPYLEEVAIDEESNSKERCILVVDRYICSKTTMLYRKVCIPFNGNRIPKSFSVPDAMDDFTRIRRGEDRSTMVVTAEVLDHDTAELVGCSEGCLYFKTRRWEYDLYHKIMCYIEVYVHNSFFSMIGKNI